jgi:hypothetical protein
MSSPLLGFKGGRNMKPVALIISSLLLLLSGGCANHFAGQWLEEGRLSKDGVLTPTEGPQRRALQFDPPSLVRYGNYVDPAGVVDEQGLQQDFYFTMSDDHVAQFGAIIARVKGDLLTTYIAGDPDRVYVRIRKKPDVFPSRTLISTSAARATEPPISAIEKPIMASVLTTNPARPGG